ncbi:MAG: hypothetical protein WHU94_09735 [Thermogemmata sp.]|jgi:hypothetical protein
MSESHFTTLFISISAGLSLFFLGINHLATQRRHAIIRLLGAALAVLPGAAVLGLIERWDCLPAFAAIVGAALLVHSLWGCSLWTRGAVRLIHLTHQPWLRSALLVVAGPCLALAGILQFERREDQMADAVIEEMMLIHGVAGNVQVRDAVAITDRGRHIPLGEPIEVRSPETVQAAEKRYLESTRYIDNVILRGFGDDRSNCHGWVFTAGRYLLSGQDVLKILEDNGYQEVSDPRPNDLAVYFNPDYGVTHTAIVRYVSPDQPVLVEGKWGNLGIYLHPVDSCPYGANFKFYRTRRPHHLLTIVEHKPSADGTSSPSPAPASSQPDGDPPPASGNMSAN